MSKPDSISVSFHLGAEHAVLAASPNDTLAMLKEKALAELKIVPDPSIDYLVSYEGRTQENEGVTLALLLDEHLRPRVEFHLKKRPKGG